MKMITEEKLRELLTAAWKDGYSKSVEDETGFIADENCPSRYWVNSPGCVARRDETVKKLLQEASKQ